MRIEPALLLAAALLASCGNKRTRGPLDYLSECTPGESPSQCARVLGRTPKNMFPAGRLERIEFDVERVPKVDIARIPPGETIPADEAFFPKRVFVYSMSFNVGREDVLKILESELGERLGHGAPPVHTIEVLPGDFWRTEDGVWVCGEKAVAWYSYPFQVDERHPPSGRTLDRYLQHVPKTAALWDRIGRLLIGLDVNPRQP